MKLSPALEARILELADAIDGKPVGAVEQVLADTISEIDFDRAVVELAEAHGWWTFHVNLPRRSKSGWPDRVFLRHRCFVAELKVGDNQPTAAQLDVLDRFQAAGIDAHVWRPSDWPEIVRTLSMFPEVA